jgi:hypothetical protein
MAGTILPIPLRAGAKTHGEIEVFGRIVRLSCQTPVDKLYLMITYVASTKTKDLHFSGISILVVFYYNKNKTSSSYKRTMQHK